MKDFGDKLPADKKAPIEAALAKLKEAHKSQNIEGIDAATTELNTVFQAASEEMYKAQGAEGAQGAGPQPGSEQGHDQGKPEDDVTDVDFEEVK